MYLGERIGIREDIIYAIDGLGSLPLVSLFPVIPSLWFPCVFLCGSSDRYAGYMGKSLL